MRRDLKRLGFTRLRVFNASNIEELVVLGFIELMSEFIYSRDSENSAESIDSSFRFDFIASQIVISNEVLTRLVYCKALRKLLSLQQQRERVSAIIWMVDLSDFNSVISQVVVNDERKIITLGKEPQYFSVVIQKLLLGNYSSTTKCLLQELFHFSILLSGNSNLSLLEVV